MDCRIIHGLTDKEFWTAFRGKVARRRIPLSGSIELTRRCNLNCVHCYLGDQRAVRKKSERELDTEQWMKIIDEFSDAGCLNLLISGGEPLLRKDFRNIYRHAKRKGLIVTVFSNATRVSEPILALFEDFPPFNFEVSVYGATAKTYESITGVKGSFDRCIRGIERLLQRGIHLNLKTVLMKDNLHEIEMLEAMARKYGVGFRFDAALTPCLTGNRSPVDRRVAPAEVVEQEFANAERKRKWVEYYARTRHYPASEVLYDCGAGLFSFHVTAYGDLQPCLMTEQLRYDLTEGDFSDGWHHVIPRIKDRKVGPDFACIHCEKRTLCGFCPALFRLENHSEHIPSAYLCEIGRRRFEAIRREMD